MVTTTYTENEIYLGGYRLPTRGRIQVVKATVFPGKVTIGKATRADQVIADEWVQDDWRDGMLIEQLDETVHRGRFYHATCDTLRKRKLLLLPYVTSIGNPTTTTPQTACDFLITFNGYLYASFDGLMYRWRPDTGWSTQLANVGGPVFDGAIYKGNLYLSRGSGYYIHDGITWTLNPEDITHFTKFDVNPLDKLVAIDGSNLLKASADGVTWTTDIGGQLFDVTPTDLLVFRNPGDEPTLFVATTTGLHSVDVWTKTTYPTALALLDNPDAGKGCIVWSDGNLYFPDGLALWRYPRIGQITNVGLDKDDGLPTYIRGRITNVTSTPSYLIAVIDATRIGTTQPETWFLAGEWGVSHIPKANVAGFSSIVGSNGTGWHTLFLSSSASKGIHAIHMSTAFNNSERRLFFADDLDVKYLSLPEGNYDPSQDPNAKFASSGEFISSWFDSGYAEITKLGVSLRLRTLNITTSETVQVYYGVNDSPAFTYLGTINPSTIDSYGRATFSLSPPDGIVFYTIRLKFVLLRGNDNSKTPVILFFDLRHKKMPDVLWGYTFTVYGTDVAYLKDVWKTLKTMVEAKKTMLFGFRADGADNTIVEINSISGIRYGGTEPTAYFTLTVVELET